MALLAVSRIAWFARITKWPPTSWSVMRGLDDGRSPPTQTVMPPALATNAMTTTCYAGVLAGLAAIGFVSTAIGLHNAFWMLVALI